MTRALALIAVGCILNHLGCVRTPPSNDRSGQDSDAIELARIIKEERLRENDVSLTVERAREDGIFDKSAIAFFESFAKTAEAIGALNQSQTIEWQDSGSEAGLRVGLGGKAIGNKFAAYFRYLVHLGREAEALEQVENAVWFLENNRSHDVDPYMTQAIQNAMRHSLTSAVAADAMRLKPENFKRAATIILENWNQEPSPKDFFDQQLAFIQRLWEREIHAANNRLDALSEQGQRLLILLTGPDSPDHLPAINQLAQERMNSVEPIHAALEKENFQEGTQAISGLSETMGSNYEDWIGWARRFYIGDRREALRMRMLELGVDDVTTGTVDGDREHGVFGIPIEHIEFTNGIQFSADLGSWSSTPVVLRVGDSASFVTSLQQGAADAVSTWLENGANPNALTSTDETPLNIAAAHGHLELVQLLIEQGAQINGTNAPDRPSYVGMTEEMAKLYGYVGPLPHAAEPLPGETALDAAESNEQTEVASWLRANGAKTIEELNRERGFKKSEETHRWERIQAE